MPKDTNSPFTPGVPVSVDNFVGRPAELDLLLKKLHRVAQGRLEIGFLIGERGIGKSSLASIIRHQATQQGNLVGLHTFLGGVSSLQEMVRRILDRLLKESIDTPWYQKIHALFGTHIQQVGLFGLNVEFRASPDDLQHAVHDFVPILRNIIGQIEEKKGLFIILDDVDGLASSSDFANWLKSVIDEIATSQQLPVCLLLVGLSERRSSLVSLQPSLARVFELIEVHAWEESETREFYDLMFGKAGMQVEEDAMGLLVRFTGGLPMLAHEIGDAAFNADIDGTVDRHDAGQAIVSAADIVGRKHLQPQVFNLIRSPRYRSILRTLAKDYLSARFHRGDVLGRLTPSEVRVFDNFLRRMGELGVVARTPERELGSYRFTNLLHFLYFQLEAERAAETIRVRPE
jgi:hypothetical protein